jgi:DNA-binding PadR family transcriptional regulator
MPRHKRGWAIEENGKHKKRRTPLTVSLVEPALLILIGQQARHGYALHSELKMLGIRPIHPSVVYRTLRQMEALKWIQAGWDTDSGQGPPRKIFSLAPLGEQALQTWKEELLKAQESIAQLLAKD